MMELTETEEFLYPDVVKSEKKKSNPLKISPFEEYL